MQRASSILSMKCAGLLQLHVVAAILLGCLLLPRSGGAVLLIPMLSKNMAIGRFAVLRAGWLRGSVLVRIDGDVPVGALLRQGVLPLGAPAWLCAPTDGRTRERA